jgi:hypothetical protein
MPHIGVSDYPTGGIPMTTRPDPTFHASPKLAMEAPLENFAYTVLLSPDFSKPDALAVIDAIRTPLSLTATPPWNATHLH